jgi:hypothetical protein
MASWGDRGIGEAQDEDTLRRGDILKWWDPIQFSIEEEDAN